MPTAHMGRGPAKRFYPTEDGKTLKRIVEPPVNHVERPYAREGDGDVGGLTGLGHVRSPWGIQGDLSHIRQSKHVPDNSLLGLHKRAQKPEAFQPPIWGPREGPFATDFSAPKNAPGPNSKVNLLPRRNREAVLPDQPEVWGSDLNYPARFVPPHPVPAPPWGLHNPVYDKLKPMQHAVPTKTDASLHQSRLQYGAELKAQIANNTMRKAEAQRRDRAEGKAYETVESVCGMTAGFGTNAR